VQIKRQPDFSLTFSLVHIFAFFFFFFPPRFENGILCSHIFAVFAKIEKSAAAKE